MAVGVETVVLTLYSTVYGNVYGVLVVLLDGGVLTMHRTVAKDESVLLSVAMHGTMAMGRVSTVYSAMDGGVLSRVVMHETVKGTIHGTVTVGDFTGNLASRQRAGTGLLSR